MDWCFLFMFYDSETRSWCALHIACFGEVEDYDISLLSDIIIFSIDLNYYDELCFTRIAFAKSKLKAFERVMLVNMEPDMTHNIFN